jgi:hypothetical protein
LRNFAEIPDWSQLRYVGSSLPARLTILFPIFANFIIFNKYIVEQFSGDAVLFRSVSGIAEKFDFYLYYTFSGILVFSLGELIFIMFCPGIVKKFLDADNFVRSLGPGNVSKSMLFSWALEAEGSPHISSQEKSLDGIESAISMIEGKPLQLPDMNEQLINVSRIYYKSASLKYPPLRFMCGGLFSIGLVLIFIPTFTTILEASKIVFPQFAYWLYS